jgi:hypothetical protein
VKPEYHKGKKTLKKFERTMTALFRVPKSAVKSQPKPVPKKKGKD